MPRKEDEPLVRKHLFLYERDWERVEALWGKSIGPSKAVRLILRKFLDNAEHKANETTTRMQKELTDHDILQSDECTGDDQRGNGA